MSKNVIIGLLIAILIAAAGGAYIFLSDDEDGDDTNTVQQNSNSQQDTDNPLGVDIASLSGPYKVTVNMTEADGTKNSAVVEVDGQGNSRTTLTNAGQTTSIILLDNVTYTQDPTTGAWFSFPAGSPSSPDTDFDFGLSQNDIDEIKNDTSIKAVGEGSCAAGTCRIFEDNDPTSGETGIIKVDKATNRLSELEINDPNGEKTMVVYDFGAEINITAPEGAQEFTVPSFDPSTIPQ